MIREKKNIQLLGKFVLLIVLIVNFLGDAKAQRRYPYYKGWKSQFFLGTTNFKGDIQNTRNGFIDNSPLSKFFYEDRRVAGGIRIEKHFTSMFSLSGQLMFGSVAGTNDFELMSFKANILEYTLLSHFYVSDAIWGHDRRRKWNAYVFLGVGMTESRTWRYSTLGGDLIGVNGFGKKGIFFIKSPMTELVIPMGLGGSYNLYEQADLTVEYSFHPINTDMLDDLASDRKNLEGFGMFSVGLTMRFQTPKNWSFRRGLPTYNGKSSDPAIRRYNKRKRVVMTTRGQHRKAVKKRYSYKRKRFKRKRRLRLSR